MGASLAVERRCRSFARLVGGDVLMDGSTRTECAAASRSLALAPAAIDVPRIRAACATWGGGPSSTRRGPEAFDPVRGELIIPHRGSLHARHRTAEREYYPDGRLRRELYEERTVVAHRTPICAPPPPIALPPPPMQSEHPRWVAPVFYGICALALLGICSVGWFIGAEVLPCGCRPRWAPHYNAQEVYGPQLRDGDRAVYEMGARGRAL